MYRTIKDQLTDAPLIRVDKFEKCSQNKRQLKKNCFEPSAKLIGKDPYLNPSRSKREIRITTKMHSTKNEEVNKKLDDILNYLRSREKEENAEEVEILRRSVKELELKLLQLQTGDREERTIEKRLRKLEERERQIEEAQKKEKQRQQIIQQQQKELEKQRLSSEIEWMDKNSKIMKKLGVDLHELKRINPMLFEEIKPLIDERNYSLAKIKVSAEGKQEKEQFTIDKLLSDYIIDYNSRIPQEIKEILKSKDICVGICLNEVKNKSSEEINTILTEKALSHLNFTDIPIGILSDLLSQNPSSLKSIFPDTTEDQILSHINKIQSLLSKKNSFKHSESNRIIAPPLIPSLPCPDSPISTKAEELPLNSFSPNIMFDYENSILLKDVLDRISEDINLEEIESEYPDMRKEIKVDESKEVFTPL